MPAVGKDFPHDSALTHVSGESIFIDDMPLARNELFVDFVGSPVAHGRLKSIDGLDEARQIAGVVALFTAKDVPGHNKFGPVVKDEHLLVSDVAEFLGDPVVLVAAESREAIRAARRIIKIQMEQLPPIFSIDEAIEKKNFIGPKRTIARGDARAALKAAEHTLEGSLDIGGQEHFYLENQAALAYPGESGQVIVHSSTQHPTEVQSIVAEICGVPFNHVIVVCKRMGGGFGGKETQAAQPAAMAAMVASLTHRPTRVAYNKDDDMRYTGKRHPYKNWYKVGFDSRGRITAVVIDHFANAGCTLDLSAAVLERAMLHTDNAYFLSDVEISGQLCKTNLPSNTAFRGFGGPQGVAAIENIIESIAQHLSIDSLDVRRANLYGIDDCNTAPYGQLVKNNTLPRLFDDLPKSAEYQKRREAIDAFNSSSGTFVKGLSITPVKFGISFTKKTLNQANALVNIYTDGTVMVSTGGTEMGQGVNTRVRQIVADELGVTYDKVIVATTSTEKNNNTSPTAASSGTDLNGAAAADACGRLRDRLKAFCAQYIFNEAEQGLAQSPLNVVMEDDWVYDDRNPDHKMTFEQVICRAYIERVNLGERGFYATPGVDFNRETGKGHPFLYYTNGAACSEVLIDRLTGEMKVTRVDILMDIGVPINPSLDRGQLTGGFIQGVGWVTNEELRYGAGGELLSHSPTTYKIPNIGEFPAIFNLDLLDNPDNTISLRKSKAVGEPPLLLGLSVWTAAKNALSYLSAEEIPNLAIPATGERLLMMMTDYESRRSPSEEKILATDEHR